MDHCRPPPDPTQPPPADPRNNALNAAPHLKSTNYEEESAQQNSLPLKNFRALVFKFIKPLTPADESLIEQRLHEFFPAIYTIPDHPPYSAMIEEAVEKLNGGRGSSEAAISEYIKNEYKSLPWAHATILSHHLNKLSKKGDIIVRCGGDYILRSAIISSSLSDSPSPISRRLKRKMKRTEIQIQGSGRGKPHKCVPCRGRGRPRKKDEVDGQFQVDDENFKLKWLIKGRKLLGRQKKNNDETSEGYQLKEEQTDVDEEHHQAIKKEHNQLVEVEPEDPNQVAIMEMEDIKENNDSLDSDYSPGSSSERGSDSLDSDYSPGFSSERGSDSPGSESSPRRRTRNRKKSQIRGRGRGGGRKHVPGRGRGRPRKKKDEIDGLLLVHAEKFKRKRVIQKRGRSGSQSSRMTIYGKKWGRPPKNNKTSEEHTNVGVEHNEGNQLVELLDVIEDHNQVADMRMQEIKENNDLQVQNQVVLEQNKAEELHIANFSETQGYVVEEQKKHKEQEKVLSEVLIQPQEQQMEVIVEKEEQREELQTHIRLKQDELFNNCNRKQNQEKEVIVELNQSLEDVILVRNGSIEQQMEVIEDQIHPSEQRELEFNVTEKEQHNDIAQERVQLEFDVFEGQCQREEEQTEGVQVEDRGVEGGHQKEEGQKVVVPDDIQREDKVVKEKQDVEVIVIEAQKVVEVQDEDRHREHDKEGTLDPNESEIFQQKQLINVIVEQNQLLHFIEDRIQREDKVVKVKQDVEVIVIEAQKVGEVQDGDGQREQDKEGSLDRNESEFYQQKQLINVITEKNQFLHVVEDRIQKCEIPEKEIQIEQESELVNLEKDLEEVEAFEKENQLKGKRNSVNVESFRSCDVKSSDSTTLPCKTFWSMMEDEKDKFLNNFIDQEMKSPCRKREISDISIMSEQELIKLSLQESSRKSGIEQVSYIHIPRPWTRLQHKNEQRRSGLRPRTQNVDVVTSENQPVRRSPRHLNACSEELDQSKERPKRSGLRSEKNKKGEVSH